jgi:IclR family acetate operon transcriptional repressor
LSTSSGHVQSVARAMELLKAVATARGAEASVLCLSRRCGINRATAWRLLTTLEAQELVSRDPRTGWYGLGSAVADLDARRQGNDNLIDRARPVLERLSLETGEIASLGAIDGGRLEYALEVIPANVDSLSWLGVPMALHATSMGKAFLASVGEDEARVMLGQRLTRFTAATITDLDELMGEIRQIRASGYAVCRGELELGSWGVAAPVPNPRGEVIAFLCLWGPDGRGDDARLVALGRLAQRAARDLVCW